MPIIVPPSMRAKLARENLVKATLHVVADAGDAGFPVSRLRTGFQRMGVPTALAEHVEARLVRDRIVVLKADRLHLGTLEDIQAFLRRTKWDEGRVAAVAPEQSGSEGNA